MIAIISVALVIIVPLFIWLWKSYVVGPELTIELIKTGSSSSPRGFSNQNIAVNGVIEMRDAIQLFQLQWNLEIVIRNNSEYTAYYPKIVFNKDQPPFLRITKLNELEPIPSKRKVVIEAVYQEYEECKGGERNNMQALPIAIKGIKVLIEYKNASKSKFYTVFNNTDKSNSFMRRKPKEFKS